MQSAQGPLPAASALRSCGGSSGDSRACMACWRRCQGPAHASGGRLLACLTWGGWAGGGAGRRLCREHAGIAAPEK